MANPFFNAIMGGQQASGPQLQQNIVDAARQLKRDPISFLLQRRYNIPSSASGSPDAIMSYLYSTGQVTPAQFQNFQNGRRMNYGR